MLIETADETVEQSPYNPDLTSFKTVKSNMCEFNVILNGKTEFNDVIYAKAENGNVTVTNILGETKEFKNCRIIEVDVNATRLVLTSA